MSERILQLGIVGLGRAFTVMLPTFIVDQRVRLVAAADPRPEARQRFASDFGNVYSSIEMLCADPVVEAVYIASPHEMHANHVRIASAAGKHALVEKPMAITLADCRAMIDAARDAGVHLIVGHSHSFNRPIQRTRELIASGSLGALRMMTAINYTDFLYRPRRPEELATERGGGVVFSQAAHQVDVVRLLGGGHIRSVRAATGSWDPARPTEGAYSALLTFENGCFASLVYSGYAHFDSDEFCGWIGEMGRKKDPASYGTARRALQSLPSAEAEAALKNARSYGGRRHDSGAAATSDQGLHQHFGFVLASCERADLRPLPGGVMIYGDASQRLEQLPPPSVPRAEVIDELYGAVVSGKAPVHNGEWALATMEVCLALLESARAGKEVTLRHQVRLRDLTAG
jgi:phthalate 4,5-cis-dihydrodiol dehydrogenase